MVGCESSDRRPQHLQMCAYRRCRLAEWGWLDCNIELKRRRRTAKRSVWAGAGGWGLRWRKRGRGRDPRFRRRVVEQLRISAILCIAELGLAVNPYSFCKDHDRCLPRLSGRVGHGCELRMHHGGSTGGADAKITSLLPLRVAVLRPPSSMNGPYQCGKIGVL